MESIPGLFTTLKKNVSRYSSAKGGGGAVREKLVGGDGGGGGVKSSKVLIETEQAYSQRRQSARLLLRSSELEPPTPSPAGGCVPSPFGWGEPLACGRGGGGVPIRTKGQTLSYSRYMCTLWA